MKLHRTIARLFGYELIKRQKSPSPDAHLINLITYHNIDLVLDVGANRGQFAYKLRREGYEGDIHSFEPISEVFKELSEKTYQDKGWHAHQLALGSEFGFADVNVSTSSDLSSFLKANDFGHDRYKNIKPSKSEKVTVDTLDRFLPREISDYQNRNILLKMDTQGFDLEVFNGAVESVPHIHCILSELSLIPIYEDMPHYIETLRAYEKAGFAVTGLFPISRDADFSVVEMDCFMVNRKMLGSPETR